MCDAADAEPPLFPVPADGYYGIFYHKKRRLKSRCRRSFTMPSIAYYAPVLRRI